MQSTLDKQALHAEYLNHRWLYVLCLCPLLDWEVLDSAAGTSSAQHAATCKTALPTYVTCGAQSVPKIAFSLLLLQLNFVIDPR